MTADIIKFEDRKKDPHLSGEAKCTVCGREWVAVCPEDVDWLECPECNLIQGHMVHHVFREYPHWRCNCGGELFYITPVGSYCTRCGSWALTE